MQIFDSRLDQIRGEYLKELRQIQAVDMGSHLFPGLPVNSSVKMRQGLKTNPAPRCIFSFCSEPASQMLPASLEALQGVTPVVTVSSKLPKMPN